LTVLVTDHGGSPVEGVAGARSFVVEKADYRTFAGRLSAALAWAEARLAAQRNPAQSDRAREAPGPGME
jgi:hypothetical protein